MKNKLFLPLIALATISSLAGCGTQEFEIELASSIPEAYVAEEYDFEPYIVKQKGAKYSIEVKYQNYYTMEEIDLDVNGFKFTPLEQFELSILITAKKQNEKIQRTTLLPVSVKGDKIDELLISDGWSGWADTGFRKQLNLDPNFIKQGNSSIFTTFQGNNVYQWGAGVLAINNFRCLDEWTDKTWANAILTFWVYNPTEYEFTFGLRIKDASGETNVDIDWGQSGSIYQTAEPGAWTQVFFPLHKYGLNHTLYQNETGTRNDDINIKVRWGGTPTSKPTPLYSYSLYLDGVDVVPNTQYPEIDTSCPDTNDNLLYTQSWCCDELSKEPNYNMDYVKEGQSSIKYSFDGTHIFKSEGGAHFISLSNPLLQASFTDKKWEDATIGFWFYNPTDEDFEMQLFYSNHEKTNEGDWGAEHNLKRFAAANDWTYITFPLLEVGIDRVYYINYETGHHDEINVKLRWGGTPSEASHYSFSCYVDALDVFPTER